ncbi:hypothetical protein EV644_103103 [Kribbella orskensis]|uniref:GIY-YIG domain-containing protein n=1 Tax=Kribbella orskensis TaxID=2512216 RepID=A0ABY2BP49_9ACTN|nr:MULTISPECIES: hypothetical protein [Kribbella]TCN39811.1 hypothetical protein EV642_106317 [Kribbella sp. VKM Ac-2500]TCO27406.1 hypothetical protein EV644_103103 [Kribbella orskensis]
MKHLGQLDTMAEWSTWVPLKEAIATAPLLPGVYMAREGARGAIVYVGMAGERAGKGIRGRLHVYSRGKGLVSGLGEAAMDRALADPAWLRARLAEVEAGEPMRAKQWGQAAIERADLQLRWAVTADRHAARALERAVLSSLVSHELWNRLR